MDRRGRTTARFLRFAVVGGGMAALNLLLLWALVERAGVPYLLACTIAFFALNALGYLLNKVFTFERPAAVEGPELVRYYLVMAASLAANLTLMVILVDGLGLGVLVASVTLSVLLAVANFAGHSIVTFRRAHRPPPDPSAPLSVLQVSAFFPAHGGGIEVVAGQLATRLAAAGVKVTWMAGGPVAEWPSGPDLPGVRVIAARQADPLERRIGLPAPIWGPASLTRLWRATGEAEVVHIHDYLYLPTLAAAAAAAARGRPLVITQHIGEIPLRSPAARRLLDGLNRTLGALVLSGSEQAVFVGAPVRATFARFTRFRRPPELVPNGVDHQVYRPDPARVPLDGRDVRLLFVGRLVEKKGVHHLRASATLPGASWTFIGGGPLSPAAWGVDGLQVLGRLPPPAIVPHYQAADLLVLPSTGEGFPLVLQEALACGTPVLVSAEVAEAFPATDPRCVFPVELRGPDPAGALREALAALVADRDRLVAAREPALALSRQWSWEACVAAYRRIYAQVARGEAAG